MSIVRTTPPVGNTPPGNYQHDQSGRIPMLPYVQYSPHGYPINGGAFTDVSLNMGQKLTQSNSRKSKKSSFPKFVARLLNTPSSDVGSILNLINSMTQDQLNHVTENGDSALQLALSTNADPKIITALAKKCDVNQSLNDNNDTALTSAIYNGRNKAGILALIEAMTPEQLNHVTVNGNSALLLALSTNADPEIITALAKKCDVNQSLNENNDTALLLAIVNGFRIDGILALIKEMEPDQLKHVTKNGNSALLLATNQIAHLEIITALAEKCDVNQTLNANNDTALILAIVNGFRIDGILALIKEMEPDQLNHVTINGNSALRLALDHLPVDQLVRFLFAYSKKKKDKLKTASLSIFTAIAIPMIIHGLKTVKKTVMERLDIQRIKALYTQYLQIDDAEQKKEALTELLKTIKDQNIEQLGELARLITLQLTLLIEALHTQYLQIDDAEQKKDALTQLLKTIKDQNIEQLGELARLITLQLALLKHEDLRNQDIQDYFENTLLLDFFKEIMGEDPDPNDDLWVDVGTDRILAQDVEFFIQTDKAYPFDWVVSLDTAQRLMRTHPLRFRTPEEAAAYSCTNCL